MEITDRKSHWENIYTNKALNEVSWYQPVPTTSLDLIEFLKVPKEAAIIDIGGGDSFLADRLLELGYQDITVLDISSAALDRARQRLGSNANRIKWIVADAAVFVPERKYDLWHDRAVFHFLTEESEIQHYVRAAAAGVKAGGVLIVGTFSEQGPKKCSGIPITQYSEASLTERFNGAFAPVRCFTVDHPTPFNTTQNFVFCGFTRT